MAGGGDRSVCLLIFTPESGPKIVSKRISIDLAPIFGPAIMSEVELFGFTDLLQHLAALQRRLPVPDSLNWNMGAFHRRAPLDTPQLAGGYPAEGDSP